MSSIHQISPTAMRIARPTEDLAASAAFYVEVLGLQRLGSFEDHSGYSGVFIGLEGADWHIELTQQKEVALQISPTDEDLLVLYLVESEIQRASLRLGNAGSPPVDHENPYWSAAGARLHRDPDGYLLVLHPV
jgi:catechol 2,3-dioxygenase-like lactoylglutathione lyase family enzyme